MRIFIICLIIIIAGPAWVEDHAVVFSAYDPAIKLVLYDPASSTAKFEGQIFLDGIVYFDFDSDENKKSVDILFARFVPSEKSKELLPSVIGGYYPGRVDQISLEPADLALVMAYGSEKAECLKHGGELTINVPAQITLYKLTASIECDARSYWSTSFSIKPLSSLNNIVVVRRGGGC